MEIPIVPFRFSFPNKVRVISLDFTCSFTGQSYKRVRRMQRQLPVFRSPYYLSFISNAVAYTLQDEKKKQLQVGLSFNLVSTLAYISSVSVCDWPSASYIYLFLPFFLLLISRVTCSRLPFHPLSLYFRACDQSSHSLRLSGSKRGSREPATLDTSDGKSSLRDSCSLVCLTG